MVLGMLYENFKNYYILRYVIYEFLKKVLGGPQPTCLVRVFCAVGQKPQGKCPQISQYVFHDVQKGPKMSKKVK